MPLISICIPAYKRTEFLKRLLDSIAVQSFKDFEIIVTDDSPGNDVKELCNSYQQKLQVFYFKNDQQLGTPENWNEGIRKAKGQWIKLMHDDDWFNNENSLQSFANAIKDNPDCSFFFSAYRNIYLEEKRQEDIFPENYRYKMLLENVATLFSKNIIGPPSVTLHKNDGNIFYDKNLKWLVDIDFYMRYIKTKNTAYINQPLINVGLSADQVTKEAFRNRSVEIPESFYLFEKIGFDQLKNIYVYDAWWRLLRNLGIRSMNDIYESGYAKTVPTVINEMIGFQKKISLSVLKIGMLSKFFMSLNFIKYRVKKAR